MKPLLEIRNVSLSYHTVSGETKALSNISFDLMPGEFLAVVGPSGCGKSTLLNLICGMLPAEEGTILMNGIPPSPGDPRIGYMLQKDHLLEWRSIYRNILLGVDVGNCDIFYHDRRRIVGVGIQGGFGPLVGIIEGVAIALFQIKNERVIACYIACVVN